MSNNSNLFKRSASPIFEPKFTRGKPNSTAYLAKQSERSYTLNDLKDTNVASTSSYRYGDKDYLVSTQQVRTDYSKFENHTFFHSAVANVNEAFDRIINFYPFDKDKKTIEVFEDNLTGFEKYILDSFPKNIGYINFSGSNGSVSETIENGTYIDVIDRSGASIENLTERNDGKKVLDPLTSSFSIEFWLNVPDITNDNQIVFQKRSSLSNNFTLALSQSSSTSNCDIHFGITSGSNYVIVSGSIEKGKFSHVTAMYDRLGDQRAKLLINNNVHSSSQQMTFGNLDYGNNSFYIGKGENVRLNNTVFNSIESFSGSIDDFKFFHKTRNISQIKLDKYKNFYPSNHDIDDSLKLYFKFNEPSGSYNGNDVVIDSSGYSLHARISNYIGSHTRTTGSSPVLSEELAKSPVLFPGYSDVNSLNLRLLTTASLYDDYNPNLITKLVPEHYFDQGTLYRDYTTELDNLGQSFATLSNNNTIKNKSDLPASTQVLLKLLFTYAKFFDELKIYIDTITSFRSTLYNDFDTTPDALLIEKAKLTNTHLPNMFKYATLSQFFDGVDLGDSNSVSTLSLNQIQKEIWRRYITEAPRQNLKKGTLDSIKAIFRNAGIEPDNIFSFREYGGSTEKSLDMSKELKKDVFNFLSFTGSYGKTTTANDAQGYPTDAGIPRIKSGYLSGSRIQPGVPRIRGQFVDSDNPFHHHGISNNASDGLLTSGSFTYEGFYKWNRSYNDETESLIRLHTTGTIAPSTKEGVIVNLIADNQSLNLFVNDSISTTPGQEMKLLLTGANIFDNDIWYVSFGKNDSHDLSQASSGSYFIRAAKQLNGNIIEQYFTSSFLTNYENSILKNKSEYNTSGSFLVIGSQSFQEGSTYFLNHSASNSNARTTSFTGLLANPRFFSKGLTEKEWKSHAKNYRSHGVDNPLKNYNFSNNVSGSFERLVLLTDAKQNTTDSDATGNFRLFDFSQNGYHFEGSNFTPSVDVTVKTRVDYEILSDKFDINQSRDKIRIRSFQDEDNLTNSYFTAIAPVSKILPSEESMDDTRFSIDMSVMKALNEHILLIFSDYSQFENIYGKPNTIFSDTYHEAVHAREIFFNNLLEKIDLQKYRNLFKWVDTTFTHSIFKTLPRHTTFLGINFVYEGHVLERNRMRYLSDEIYMRALQRDPSRGNIFLSQFSGRISKF